MGIYKIETKKMEFNGYNYKAEWSIPNFAPFVGNTYNSPIFSTDDFKVQLSVQRSLSKDSEGLEITFSFVSIPNSGLSLNYTLTIENTESNKAEKITGDDVLSNSKKDIKIFTKTKSDELTAENGFLKDGTLKISCLFKSNSGTDADFISYFNHETIKREAVADASWIIKQLLSDFHSTEEPLQVSIKGKILSFALTFELTEISTYALTLILIEPEFSFNGEIEITLVNQKDNKKNITKTKKLRFDSIFYNFDPISYDELTQDDLNDPENGWIIINKDTQEIETGMQFNIQFISLEKEEESKESVFSRLSQMTIYNEKELREIPPITIPPVSTNKYNFVVTFPKILSNDLNESITTPEYHTGGICEKYTIDFQSKSLLFTITDYPQTGSFLNAEITFLNKNPKKSIPIKMSILYCNDRLTDSKELPFSVQDVKDPEKGWLIDDDLQFRIKFESKSYTTSYLYPVTTNNASNDLYGFRFFIPISLFDPKKEDKIIDFPQVNSKKLNFTPFINYSYDENNKLNIKTLFNIRIPKEESIIDFIFSYDNKDEKKHFISSFTDVETDQIQMPLFIPEKSFEEDGFVFNSKRGRKVLHLSLRIHYKEKNSYVPSSVDPYALTYQEKKTQDESKMPAMLPDKTLNSSEQNSVQTKITDYFDNKQFNDDAVTGPHDFQSKKDTGYVGLKNQGATCYMNSLLQSLYHLPAFRRLVYEMPTTGVEDPETSIPLNLQRLFCKMQFSDRSCSTVNLTKSFGWGSAETFQQHDIEEFLRVLIDNLEKKMQGTDLKDSIPHLFKGKYRKFIKCLNVDYQSESIESFYDLSMDVKGIPNLLQSFKRYVQQEELTGDNQYNTEKHGKQDAVMGTEFIEFPPVLHLHLRRFMFDFNLPNGMYKINDQFEFPQSIDLREFLAKDSPDLAKSNIYDLYGVLVHQGGVFGGHYYAFLRTSTSTQWYKFNDSIVTKDTAQHAINDNYGYSPNSPKPPRNNENEDQNNISQFSSSDEENEHNEELDEIVNDHERMFTRNQSAQMGIDICGGREEDDIHIRLGHRDYEDLDKYYHDVVENDERYYRNNLHRNKHPHHHHPRPHSQPRNEKSYSGYMLVYVRREDADQIFEPISDDSVPKHLKTYMDNLFKEEKSQAKDKTTIKIHFAHESILKTNSANNIIGFFPPEIAPPPPTKQEKKEDEEEGKDKEPSKVNIYTDSFNEKFEKSISTAELYSLIASKMNLDPSKVRLWRCGYGDLPTRIIPNSATSNVAGVSDNKNYMTVFVQSIKEDEKLDIGNSYMIYVKFFFSEDLLNRQSLEDKDLLQKEIHTPLQFLFSTAVNRKDKIESLVPLINEKLGFPKDSKLDVYQETLNKTVTKEKLETVFDKTSIGSGSTLIFEMNQESIEKIPSGSLKINFDFAFPTIIEQQNGPEQNSTTSQLKLFKQNELDTNKNPYKSIQNFIQDDNSITLEIYDYKQPTKPLFLIRFSRDIKIVEVKKFILKALFETKLEKEREIDLSSVILFRMKNNEITKIEMDQAYTNQILRFHFNDEPPKGCKYHQIYYYLTQYSGLKSYEFIKYTVQFSADAKSIDATQFIYLPESCKCNDIFNSLKEFYSKEETQNEQIKEMFNENNTFRYLLINSQVIERVFTSKNATVPYESKKAFRIEIVPKNQIDIDSGKLLRSYYSLDLSKICSTSINQPFLIEVINDEVFEDTKKRLKVYMDLGEGDKLDTYKFYLSLENFSSFDEQNEKRKQRYQKLLIDNPDTKVSDSYEIKTISNISNVALDDFAMISEFSGDNTFNQQLIILLAYNRVIANIKNDAVIIDDNKNDKSQNVHKAENKPKSRPQAKSHPSHNDVKIYN